MSNRLPYIDNLRVFCIIIVVFIHSAVTYSGLGDWYYRDLQPMHALEQLFFYLFQSHAQGFSMSLFFFIAGYFIPASLERKGTKKFILDRLSRLGIPVLIYIFLIHPWCVKMAYPEVNVADFMLNGIKHLDFFSWTGPLWFAAALLIFSIIYALTHNYLPTIKNELNATTPKLISLIGLITLLAFCIRILAPIGTSVVNLQFCFFGAYIVMFYLGTLVFKNNTLSNITLQKGKHWLYIAFGIGIIVWISAIYIGKTAEGGKLIFGGLNPAAFLYALWESLFCVAFIVALMGIAKAKFNSQNTIMKFLSSNTFGIYVFHAPVLIALSVLAKNVHLHAFPKFLIIGISTVIVSSLVSWVIRQIPVVGRIFN